MSSLHIDSIRVDFGLKTVLSDIYLSCKTGDIIGIFGINGCGKSTLFKVISGMLPIKDKYIAIDGIKMDSLRAIMNKINYLPQRYLLPAHIKLKTAIQLYCNPTEAEELMQYPQIADNYNKRINLLSSGEKRFIEILLIIHSNAEFILLDEPFHSLAPLQKEVIQKAIQHKSKDKGFILTDHDFRSILKVTHINYLMADGGLYYVEDEDDLENGGYLLI